QEIYTHIAPVIANNSEQQPLCRPIKGTGDMGGEFIFISTKAAPALQKVPSPSASDTLKAEQEKLAEQRLELERQLQELELKKLEQGKLKLALEQEKLAQERKRIDEESEKNRNNKSFQIASINPADSNTKIIARDNQYIQYKTGVVFDTRTDLEWFQGPDEELDWQQAGNWAKRLDIDGGGWRIPTMNELFSLFKKGSGTKNMTGLLNPKSWWVWCKNQYYFSNNPDVYNFYTGSNPLNRKYGGSKAKYNSVFAVRKRNPESKPKIDPHDR
ncbi:MAG: DUF1566 domain-containing protein, partial [Proteobacteria bacterium]|nr:DUF1566 domain-containing protein [Pseudomonadota bacterium]